jgi:hypothetical protein
VRPWGGVRMIKINLYSVIIYWQEYKNKSNFIGEKLVKKITLKMNYPAAEP